MYTGDGLGAARKNVCTALRSEIQHQQSNKKKHMRQLQGRCEPSRGWQRVAGLAHPSLPQGGSRPDCNGLPDGSSNRGGRVGAAPAHALAFAKLRSPSRPACSRVAGEARTSSCASRLASSPTGAASSASYRSGYSYCTAARSQG